MQVCWFEFYRSIILEAFCVEKENALGHLLLLLTKPRQSRNYIFMVESVNCHLFFFSIVIFLAWLRLPIFSQIMLNMMCQGLAKVNDLINKDHTESCVHTVRYLDQSWLVQVSYSMYTRFSDHWNHVHMGNCHVSLDEEIAKGKMSWTLNS